MLPVWAPRFPVALNARADELRPEMIESSGCGWVHFQVAFWLLHAVAD